ncbi:hypothetical protein DSM03_108102 [Leeuwenhoekiella aestuarii]|uniref:Carboxypeptidase-like protein n=2 Tax=Leeuwenhoekiella TaxID=283735 RepID=A0A4Q0NRM5_9FLAO|nr:MULTISPECIES: hypothetical protein [Leeuwenhoekiella]RXG12956.1 hypothetical protein DSM03_108102 [Leeuwenhoekiella aestuarii]RXG13064.1 hypothetical protein DSM04_10541 [Leeuwenhoekiella aestuarii]RXG14718.1 hypothetical protein DSM02_3489 [Leeuwenhoekiella polynyae]
MSIKIFFTICFLAVSTSVFAQNTTGKVYAGDKRVPGVLVENRTQNKSTVTTDAGDFSIAARLNDSLVFSAPFMETQFFTVEKYQLEKVWVVELSESLNELAEVRLTEAPKEKKFDQTEYNEQVNELVRNDVKQSPQEYRPKYTSNGIDFIMLAKRFIGLFKKDPSKQQKEYAPITYEQYQILFATDDYFDQKFLNRQLQIEPYYQSLFFEYCDAMQLPGDLLLPERQLDLLDALMKLSGDFRAELKKFEEQETSLPEDN